MNRESELQRRAVESAGALTPADIDANDVEFRTTVICGWCGGEGRLTTEGTCPECQGTGEVEVQTTQDGAP